MSYATQENGNVRFFEKLKEVVSGISTIVRMEGQYQKRVGTRAEAITCLNKVRVIRITGQGVIAKVAKERTLTQAEIEGLKHIGITVRELCAEYLSYIQDVGNPTRPRD